MYMKEISKIMDDYLNTVSDEQFEKDLIEAGIESCPVYNFVKEVVVTKKVFDDDYLKTGTKINFKYRSFDAGGNELLQDVWEDEGIATINCVEEDYLYVYLHNLYYSKISIKDVENGFWKLELA